MVPLRVMGVPVRRGVQSLAVQPPGIATLQVATSAPLGASPGAERGVSCDDLRRSCDDRGGATIATIYYRGRNIVARRSRRFCDIVATIYPFCLGCHSGSFGGFRPGAERGEDLGGFGFVEGDIGSEPSQFGRAVAVF